MANLADNSKARFEYEILEHFSAGLELLGMEVKAVKSGKMNLAGSYVVIRGGEAYLTGAEISPYQPKNTPAEYESTRARRLLLTKKELGELALAEGTKGLTIVPLSVYNKGRFI